MLVRGDSALLQNAFVNIALNACDAMPRGGALDFQCSAIGGRGASPSEATGSTPRVCIAIQDSGQGMDSKVKARIFEPVFTTKQSGTGMGLAVAYGTVTRHGGEIFVDSRPGRGSCFRIYLPVDDEPSHGGESNEHERSALMPLASLRILLADDEHSILELCKRTLTGDGHHVITAPDGEVACSIYRESWREIDVVVLDLNMPRMDGAEAYRTMKAINADVRVVLLSGCGRQHDPGDLVSEGVRVFLERPFGLQDLSQALATAMA